MIVSYLHKALPRFESDVRNLAKGDDIVAKWSYMIQEKTAYLPARATHYVEEVVEWVLEPMVTIAS